MVFDNILHRYHGGVLELADRQDLGSCAERCEGSSPSFPTISMQMYRWNILELR
jgi:hypothetical protein